MVSPNDILAVLAEFASDTRLFELSWPDDESPGPLTVEAFAADDRLQGVGQRDVLVLAGRAITPSLLLHRRACLEVSLPDRTRERFCGIVTDVELLGRHGRLARYRLRLSSWPWRLTQARNCRAWEDRSVIEIVEDVFTAHQPLARWRWSEEVSSYLADLPKRAWCCQYRESDADFVTRLLNEEGMGWRFEDDGKGQQMVLFADSTRRDALVRVPGGEIRYHRAHAGEAQDAVQWAGVSHRLTPGSCTVLTYDDECKRSFSGSAESRVPLANGNRRRVEQFSHRSRRAFGDPNEAFHYATLRMQAHDVRACV